MGRLDIFKATGLEKEDPPVEEVLAPVEVIEPLFTKQDIKDALPAQLRTKVTDELMQKLNSVANDPEIAKEVRDNFIGFNSVLKDGKYKLTQYLEACSYVTYKMMGYSNQAAYGLTFPDRIARFKSEGRDDKYVSAFVSAYNKNKLVTVLLEQALVPVHILNQDLFQKAVNHAAFLMVSAKSEKVQIDAAKSLMDTLKPPESAKVEIDMTVKDSSAVDELKSIMVDVAQNQMRQIEAGASTKKIAHQDIFDRDGQKVE